MRAEDGQERQERVAELVRHDTDRVVAQIEEEARLGVLDAQRADRLAQCRWVFGSGFNITG